MAENATIMARPHLKQPVRQVNESVTSTLLVRYKSYVLSDSMNLDRVSEEYIMRTLVQKVLTRKYSSMERAVISNENPIPVHTMFLR